MKISHGFMSGIISVGFVVAAQLFVAPIPVFRYLVLALAAYFTLVGWYNYRYLARYEERNFWIWIRPLLFLCCWFGLFFIAPSPFLRTGVLLVGLPLMYLIEVLLRHSGEQVLLNQVSATGFGIFLFIAALAWYYQIPGFVYLSVLCIVTFLLVRSSYEQTPVPDGQKILGAAAIGLFTTEVFWATSFLPFHYASLALVTFAAFSFCWTLYYFYLFNHLTPRKIQYQLFLTGFVVAVLLLVTPWGIVQ